MKPASDLAFSNANLSVEDGPLDAAGTDQQFKMDWTTTGHTAVDVPLTAAGPGAKRLTGNSTRTPGSIT